VLAAVLGLGVVALVGAWSTLSAVLAVRVEAGSSPRVQVAEAALDRVAEDPVLGVGPASNPVTWPGADGSVQAMRATMCLARSRNPKAFARGNYRHMLRAARPLEISRAGH